jgi:flagellar export protein FliJ
MNKNIWTVLADKAANATRDAQAAVNAAKLKVDKLQASVDHVDRLRDDYIVRYNAAQKEAHKISDNIAYRQFLDHLQELKQKVKSQLALVELQLADAKAAYRAAQREQVKMEAMVEREERNRLLALAKTEQRTMDEMGLRAFNLR